MRVLSCTHGALYPEHALCRTKSVYRGLFGEGIFISLERMQVYTCACPRGQVVHAGLAIDGLDGVHEEY
jgi:hypothetical protein